MSMASLNTSLRVLAGTVSSRPSCGAISLHFLRPQGYNSSTSKIISNTYSVCASSSSSRCSINNLVSNNSAGLTRVLSTKSATASNWKSCLQEEPSEKVKNIVNSVAALSEKGEFYKIQGYAPRF